MKLAKEIFKLILGERLPNLDGELTTDGNDSVIKITRDDFGIPYIKATSTSDMARTCLELSDWLQRSNRVPELTTVLTGTSIVPPPDFTLQAEDRVIITIEEIGTLENTVIEV